MPDRIEVDNDHICYAITDRKTPWHLPYHNDFMLVPRVVITHVAKSKCRLAIYTMVDWSKAPKFSKGLVERQALDDSGLDTLDLADVISDQVRNLGPRTSSCRSAWPCATALWEPKGDSENAFQSFRGIERTDQILN